MGRITTGNRWVNTGDDGAGSQVYERNQQAGDPGDITPEMTKAELQAELEARGLPKTGTKEELLERLAQ